MHRAAALALRRLAAAATVAAPRPVSLLAPFRPVAAAAATNTGFLLLPTTAAAAAALFTRRGYAARGGGDRKAVSEEEGDFYDEIEFETMGSDVEFYGDYDDEDLDVLEDSEDLEHDAGPSR